MTHPTLYRPQAMHLLRPTVCSSTPDVVHHSVSMAAVKLLAKQHIMAH